MKKYVNTFPDHLARYVFAAEFCARRTVIDLGSREGFGAHLLSYFADTVTLVDVEELYLEQAREWFRFFAPDTIVKCDLNAGFPDGRWQTAVAFEVIEHVRNPDLLLKNIADHLTEDGVLVFSVPHMVANREHLTLFDERGIRDLVSRHLEITEFYTQDRKTISGRPRYKGLRCYVGVARRRAVV